MFTFFIIFTIWKNYFIFIKISVVFFYWKYVFYVKYNKEYVDPTAVFDLFTIRTMLRNKSNYCVINIKLWLILHFKDLGKNNVNFFYFFLNIFALYEKCVRKLTECGIFSWYYLTWNRKFKHQLTCTISLTIY